MEFVKLIPINRICPCCGNGNYMRIISGKYVGELNVKCINCNSYYNYDELLKRDNGKPLNGTGGKTMDDLILRAAAIDALTDTNLKRNVDSLCDGDMNRTRRAAQRVIAQLPAVDAVPVIHAKWVEETDHSYHWFCSNCKQVWGMTKYFMKFCPNCGALMDLEELNDRLD